MREIKFRAWEVKGKGWITGFNMVDYHGYFNKGFKPSIFRYSTEWEDGEYILEQFTGLHDKNGKEIYDGDIVGWDEMSEPMLCSFWRGKWVLVHKPTCRAEVEGECAHDDLFDFESEELEIIGNIHKNTRFLVK